MLITISAAAVTAEESERSRLDFNGRVADSGSNATTRLEALSGGGEYEGFTGAEGGSAGENGRLGGEGGDGGAGGENGGEGLPRKWGVPWCSAGAMPQLGMQ